MFPLWLIRGGPWFWKRRGGLPPHDAAQGWGPIKPATMAELRRDLGLSLGRRGD